MPEAEKPDAKTSGYQPTEAAPANPPLPSAPATAPAAAGTGMDKEALELFLKSLEKKGPQLKVPLASILYGDEERTQTILVPSAREDESGNDLSVEVVIRDIGDRGLMAAYSEAARRSPNEAHAMLWEKCIVSPPELADRDKLKVTMPRVPTRFKEGLTARILRANGVEGFLETMSLL